MARRASVALTEVSRNRIQGSNSHFHCQPVAVENRVAIRTMSMTDDCNARALTPLRRSSIAVLSSRLASLAVTTSCSETFSWRRRVERNLDQGHGRMWRVSPQCEDRGARGGATSASTRARGQFGPVHRRGSRGRWGPIRSPGGTAAHAERPRTSSGSRGRAQGERWVAAGRRVAPGTDAARVDGGSARRRAQWWRAEVRAAPVGARA